MTSSGGDAAQARRPLNQDSRARSNRGVAAALLFLSALLLVYLLSQDWVYAEQRDGFRLGFFSLLGAAAMLLCALAMLFDRQSRQTTPEMAKIRLRSVLYGLLALALMGVFFVLAWDVHFAQPWLRAMLDAIPLTGEFVVWATAFMTLGMYLLGVRPAFAALVSGAIVSVVIFALFRLIGITLPTALLQS